MTILDHLLKSIRAAAVFNPEIQVAPACILWPDHDRQWQAVMPLLQARLPELLVLGDYAPDKRTGPAIWLRCVLAGCIEDATLPHEHTPVLYLPGVSRQDLRAIESCADHLKPLAELQYRGVIWSQGNGKDWTILAWLKSDQGGLGLDVAQDSEAKQAMQLALHRLLDEDVNLLKGKRLDKDYFNMLLTGGDPARDVLQWLDQGDSFQASREEHEWKAFCEVCKSQLAFSPLTEGVLEGCTRLANHKGPWLSIWERFCEAPGRYPNIPAHIRKCSPPSNTLIWLSHEAEDFEGWPQWNEAQEKSLQNELMSLASLPPHEARAKIAVFENNHAHRRSLVWAQLGEAPLACALAHLATLAETSSGLAAGSVDDLVKSYASHGWQADAAAVQALAHVNGKADVEAVSAAIRSVYLPWMEASARHLQKIVAEGSYPGASLAAQNTVFNPGDCLLFVDGLRFDTAQRLKTVLELCGHTIAAKPVWAALPSVTATGKPAVSPVKSHFTGHDDMADFEPSVAKTGHSLKGGYHLKKALADAGWVLLEGAGVGDGQGMAWAEVGDIDHEGHDRGWKLAKHLDACILEIRDRVNELLAAGWKQVIVVTDHGWLLLPGGLPKVELPIALADNKWGRCASLKAGAACEERLYPWYWNPNHFVALADGVSCFKSGQEYTHGGLSLQECLTLQLTVTKGERSSAEMPIVFSDVIWKGLRCTAAIEGAFSGVFDIRKQAGDASSSVVVSEKAFKENGTASVVVENEELAGQQAFAVLLDANGTLVAQRATIIGEG